MLRQRQSLKAERQQKRQAKQTKKTAQAAIKQQQEVQALNQLSPTPATATRTYVPSLGLIFRVISVIRVIGALSSPIQDCDEVFNYWEQLHFLQFGEGKQTWEYAPQYALRSYGFLWIYGAVGWALHLVFGFRSKVQVFYALRVAMGLVSAGCEAVVVREVARRVDGRVALWMLGGLVGMAGMWHQAVALLPSSFATCLGMLGFAWSMESPAAGAVGERAVGVCAFAVAAACGWPYAAVAAVPMVVEEIVWAWRTGRFGRLRWLAAVGLAALAACLAAMAAVDSYYYGRPVVAAWNQVAYNVLGGTAGADSTLYGTEPWHFYVRNGLLNGSLLMVLALASLPLWAMYFAVLCISAKSPTDSGGSSSSEGVAAARRRLGESHLLLLYRIAPFNLALLVFSLQPHKEERFLSIVYPHMCFNAAVSLSLLHPLGLWLSGLLRGDGGIGRRRLYLGRWVGRIGWAVVGGSAVLGFLRMAALSQYHGAPVRAFMALQTSLAVGQEPGDLPLLPLGPSVKTLMGARTADGPAPGVGDGKRQQTVCMDRDWHHFPSSYWLPRGFRLLFVRWEGCAGLLPGDFVPVGESGSVRASTAAERWDFNALNRWEPSHAANSTDACDYHVGVGGLRGHGWETVACVPMLDARASRLAARVLYVPPRVARLLGAGWLRWNSMCVSRRRTAGKDRD